MNLFSDILASVRQAKLTPAEDVELVKELVSKGENMADDNKAIYEEHNTKTPHADVAEQCQCKDCKAYREGAK